MNEQNSQKKQPTYQDVKNILENFKDNKDFEVKVDKSGAIAVKYNGKNQEYFTERNYGIAHGYQKSGRWNTDKLRNVDALETAINNLFDDNYQPKMIYDEVKAEIPTLEVDEDYESLIPDTFKYFTREVCNSMTDYDVFERAMEQGKNVLLIGPTGSGKTTLPRFFCADHKTPYIRVSLNGGCTVEDLVGHYVLKTDESGNQVTEWIDGLLTIACRLGYIVVLDEINAASSEILFKLNSLLDDERILILSEKDGEIVNPHPNFRFVATCNPTELGYSGTKELNEALLDRFQMIMYVDYDERVERNILKQIVSLEDVDKIQNFAKAVRSAYINAEILTPLSTRTLINLADLMNQGMTDLIVNRFKESERTTISDQIEMHIKTKHDINGDNEGVGNADDNTPTTPSS